VTHLDVGSAACERAALALAERLAA
jgi:hypothetical protein